jgi:FtsH-binding integral membrane protein
MKPFSIAAIVLATLLHFMGTLLLVAALDRAGWAVEFGQPNHLGLWVGLTWIWAPVPMFLSRFFHPLSPMHLFTLALPWSVFVGLCFGFFVPRLSRWRRQIA